MDKPLPDATVRRLLGRLARRRRPVRPPSTTPHATDTDPNREFARKDQTAVWFFVFFHSALHDRREDAREVRARPKTEMGRYFRDTQPPARCRTKRYASAYTSIGKCNTDTAA